MIQAQLGGVDLSASKDFNIIKRQYMVDQNIIFDRSRRLIRCIIDCKVVDCDAISARHALDLSRSLSAGFWEHSNIQLRQVPQVGPAATRKLVASNINSIEKLANLDTATLERIMTRNPPFGRKMLDSLGGFPRLTLTSEILGRVACKAGENPRVKVKAHLGYRNVKTPTWNGLKPSLTFMAETSDGVIVNFWRGNVQKLTQGQEIEFHVELSGPEVDIKCHIACDEIVGTPVSFKLSPGLSASEFPPSALGRPTPTPNFIANFEDDDEFGEDKLEDNEMLAAANHAEGAPASDYGSDGFADIDDLDAMFDPVELEKVKQGKVVDSFQMENGKWTCNHNCRDGQTLKNGQTCKHKCCHEGLDKPRKPKKKVS
jgi:ATP-dependent DNA helicase HFM1/MER3